MSLDTEAGTPAGEQHPTTRMGPDGAETARSQDYAAAKDDVEEARLCRTYRGWMGTRISFLAAASLLPLVLAFVSKRAEIVLPLAQIPVIAYHFSRFSAWEKVRLLTDANATWPKLEERRQELRLATRLDLAARVLEPFVVAIIALSFVALSSVSWGSSVKSQVRLPCSVYFMVGIDPPDAYAARCGSEESPVCGLISLHDMCQNARTVRSIPINLIQRDEEGGIFFTMPVPDGLALWLSTRQGSWELERADGQSSIYLEEWLDSGDILHGRDISLWLEYRSISDGEPRAHRILLELPFEPEWAHKLRLGGHHRSAALLARSARRAFEEAGELEHAAEAAYYEGASMLSLFVRLSSPTDADLRYILRLATESQLQLRRSQDTFHSRETSRKLSLLEYDACFRSRECSEDMGLMFESYLVQFPCDDTVQRLRFYQLLEGISAGNGRLVAVRASEILRDAAGGPTNCSVASSRKASWSGIYFPEVSAVEPRVHKLSPFSLLCALVQEI